jgi:hypothetical protein
VTTPSLPQDETIAAPVPERQRPRKRRALFVGGAIVLIALLVAFVVTRGDNDEPVVEPEGEVSLVAEPTNGGLTVTRTWTLTGAEGEEFVARTAVENPTAASITDSVLEVIPKSIATSADDIDVDAGTAEVTVVEADPVLRFDVTVPAGATHDFTMRVSVPGDGATTARVLTYLADRRAAVADYFASIESSTTTATAPVTTAPPPPSAPTSNQAPVVAFNGRVVDMADDQVPSWDHFWISSSVTDADNDVWTFNTVRADSTEDIYTGACAEDPVHGCIWYWDNGYCGVDSIWVTVKDSHGNVSNEDVLKADYC